MSKTITLLGLEVSGMDQMLDICTKISNSEFAPKEKRGKPMECMLAMQYAAEVGLTPMYGLQNIAIINGKPTLWGDALLALAKNHKDFISCEEIIEGTGDAMVATCHIERKGDAPTISKFSVSDAKTANLWSKAVWKLYPRRMLQMRARGFAVRDAFPDALCGLITREEAQDYPTPALIHNVTPRAAVLEQKAIEGAPVVPELVEVERVALPDEKWHEAIRYAVKRPDNVEQMIAKMQLSYIVSDEQLTSLRNTALDQSAVSEDEEAF